MPDLTQTCAVDTGRRAFAMAGVNVKDEDVAEIYDAFTISVLIALEDLDDGRLDCIRVSGL